ncbi:MAG: ATP-dependent RecD-like DNA helicase [Eubacteriaceae bacterium]|jgi:exodeoxyribonuclease V alpha subunit
MEELTGTVANIIFRNEDKGYTVGILETDDDAPAFTGYFESIREGDYLTLNGEFVEHPVYGEQFKVRNYSFTVPATEQAVYSYLSSGILPGIGEKTAQALIQTFGTDVLKVIEKEPDKLLKIRGIGRKTLDGIVAAYQEQNETRSTIIALQEYGISASAALKLYKIYESATVSMIMENPYRIISEVPGFGFKRADQLAAKLGFERDDPRRIRAGIEWVLEGCYTAGNTYLEEKELIGKTAGTLEITEQAAQEEIIHASQVGELRGETGPGGELVYYPEELFQAEDSAALAVARLSVAQTGLSVGDFETLADNIQNAMGIKLDSSQKEAIRAAARSSLSVITGGPGTGKTTIINGILMMYESLGITSVLVAPTGRAAKRMTETTGKEAKTIHRLLEYEPVAGFTRDEDNPVETDAIIVDEASMIDIELFDALLSASAPGTRIVFVGDADQLPSVGPGNVLTDLIASEAAETVSLTRIHRQAEGSVISRHAQSIIHGDIPVIDNQSDFMLVGKGNEEVALETLIDVVCNRMPETFGFNPFSEIQVLAPFKRGTLGTENLNIEIQKKINPAAPYKKEIIQNDRLFREGDKVMQMQNNYKLGWSDDAGNTGEGVFNGDIGIITQIDNGRTAVRFTDEKEAVYERENLAQLSLAYAATIHKSQGSEFPAVVLALSGGRSPFLNRRLLYTAVTRAKKKLMIIGNRDIFPHMIRNNTHARRTSMLARRIREYKELGI